MTKTQLKAVSREIKVSNKVNEGATFSILFD
ncbi:hypothetical protein ZORO111903_13135 [Zobellia roscoffensis]